LGEDIQILSEKISKTLYIIMFIDVLRKGSTNSAIVVNQSQ